MKIWLKYVIGCILGIAAACILPAGNETVTGATAYLTELAIRIGRYALLPLLFFSFTVAVFELRESKMLLRTGLSATVIIAGAAVLLTLVGLISVLIINPQRIPIFVEEISEQATLNIGENILKLFPYSGFDVFTDGMFILPLCVFAGFAGAGCAADKNAAKPALTVFDSLSRVSYAVMSFFIDILAIGLIAAAASWTFSFRGILASGVFNELAIVLAVDFVIVAAGLYPLIVRAVLGKINPYRVLYASIAAAVTAFFYGDTNLTLPVALAHSNASGGVRRLVSSVTMPMFSIFSRGGAAMVITVCFIIIIKSYSSLGISFTDMLWISGVSVLLSFFLGFLPVGGPFVALTVLCSLYGRGFEAGYLILKPAAFFICSVAAAIDALTNMFGTYLIAERQEMSIHRETRFFI